MRKLPENHLKQFVKILATTAIVFIGFGLAYADTEISADTTVFTDIDSGHEHYVAIKYLKEKGLIEGYADGSFEPLREINRAEALKMIMGAIGNENTTNEELPIDAKILTDEKVPIDTKVLPDEKIDTHTTDNEEFSFDDVSESEWYYPYIMEAWENNIVSGYPDGLFHPENVINRAESLKISLLQEGINLPPDIMESPYTDVQLDDWFAPYAQISKERGLILRSRSSEGLYPSQNMNRGEFAELIYRILTSSEGSNFARTTWYGFEDVNWGTASGEKFDTNLPTAAHKSLPFGTELLVTNMANGKTVTVTVNDRGPYAKGMDLDLTSSAFEEIASLGAGIIIAEYKILNEDIPNSEQDYDVSEYRF